VTFLGLAPGLGVTAALDGNAIEPDVDKMRGRVSASVADVPVTSGLSVIVGPNPALAENDVTGRCFTLLDRAQIEFELKKRINDIVCSGRPPAVELSELQALAPARPLETAIGEILTANDISGN